MINPKYLAPRSVSQARLFREYDEARRYVPVYILKDWGYFDTNMTRGTYQRMIQQEYQGAGKIKGFFTDSNYRSDAYGILAQKRDTGTSSGSPVWKRGVLSAGRRKGDGYHPGNAGIRFRVQAQ